MNGPNISFHNPFALFCRVVVRAILWAFLVGIGVSLIGLPQGAIAQDQKNGKEEITLVRLTHSNGWDALPAVVAQERGFFYDQGLVVSALALGSAEATAKSLVAGSSDMAILPQRVFLALAAAELPIKAVSIVSWGMPMELVVRPEGPTSLAELRNRTIAISHGSDALAYFVRLLNSADLHAKNVTIQAMPTKALTQALAQGSVDAVFEIAPYVKAIKAVGEVRVLESHQDLSRKLGTIGSVPLVANSKFLERDPETVQRFIDAWIGALHYMQRNKEDTVRLLQLFLNRNGATVPVDLATAWFEMQRYNLYVWSDNAIADAEYNAWALRQMGVLKSDVKLRPYIDNRFASKAVKQITNK